MHWDAVLSTRLGLGKAPLAAVPLGTLPSLLQSPSHCTFLGLAKPVRPAHSSALQQY